MTIAVLPIFEYQREPNDIVVSTVAKSWLWRNLSPFILGPCKLYRKHIAMNMENGWQYSKVYKQHTSPNGRPTEEYFEWAKQGWACTKANRYPMGKGAVPEYSLWKGKALDYIEARKQIYVPLYAEAVQKTAEYAQLETSFQGLKEGNRLVLLDYDAYDHAAMGMTLKQVLNNPKRKMGHAFVLAMLLQNDKALKECDLRK